MVCKGGGWYSLECVCLSWWVERYKFACLDGAKVSLSSLHNSLLRLQVSSFIYFLKWLWMQAHMGG